MAVLIEDRYKLVYHSSPSRHPADNGRVPPAEFELYDLIWDPGETQNLATHHPEIVQRMKRQLFEWRSSCRRSLEGADYRVSGVSSP